MGSHAEAMLGFVCQSNLVGSRYTPFAVIWHSRHDVCPVLGWYVPAGHAYA